MGIYGDKELSEGKLRKCIREEITSGTVDTSSLLSDIIKNEIQTEITGGSAGAPSLFSDIIRKEIQRELTSGAEGTSSLLSAILKKEIQIELTSGIDGTSSLLKQEIRKELTSGDVNTSAAKGYAEKTFFSSTEGGATTAWDGTETTPIPANTTSDALDTVKFGMKTISFYSDVAGTLTIEVKTPATTETWLTYDTISVEAGKLDSYIISAQIIAVRLKFSAAATITAWTVMKYL